MNRTLAIALATTFLISLTSNAVAQFRPQPDSRSMHRFSNQLQENRSPQNKRGSANRQRPSRSAQESRRTSDSNRKRFSPRQPQRFENNRSRSAANVPLPRIAQAQRDVADQRGARRSKRTEQNSKPVEAEQAKGKRKKKGSRKRNRNKQPDQGSDPNPTLESTLILPPPAKTEELPPLPADQLPKIVPRTVRTPSYLDVYNSIPFSRATYNADPMYRHNGTMELLIGELRPQTTYQSPARPMSPMPSSYNVPRSYRGGRPGFNYFVIPGAPFTPLVPRTQGRIGITLP